MTDNDINDYLYNQLNALGADFHTIDELNAFIVEMRDRLADTPACNLLRIRLHELKFSFRLYKKNREYGALYKEELALIIAHAIEYFESRRN